MIAAQVHDKFKVFAGTLPADGTLGGLGPQIEGWVRSANVAPKSIGVEFLEGSGQLLISVGYRDDEPGYGIELTAVDVGRIEGLDAAGLAKIQDGMSAASAKLDNIICHELYVTAAGDLRMVFMRHRQA